RDPREARVRRSDLADARQQLGRPEAADAERRLAARDAVLARRIAVDEAFAAELRFEAAEGRAQAVRRRIGVAAQPEQQEARVDAARGLAEHVDVARELRAVAVALDALADPVAHFGEALPRRAQRALVVQRDQAFERHPAHRLRVRVMAPARSLLPDPVVRLLPEAADRLAE